MTRIIFLEFNGAKHEIDAENGVSVMQNALNNGVPGILGDCGGTCACATCHGYVEHAFAERIPPAGADERGILEGALNVEADSRLTCQIVVGPELEGMVVRLPESQFS